MNKATIINDIRSGNLTAEKAIARIRSLREAERSGKPDVHEVADVHEAQAWQETFLQDLMGIVSRLLKMKLSDFSADTPVAAMGLDSLSATELNNHVRANFGISLQATAFFECNTLRDFQQYAIRIYGEKLRRRYQPSPEPIEALALEKSESKPNAAKVAKAKGGEDPVRKNLDRLWKRAERAIASQQRNVEKSAQCFEQILLYPDGRPGINIAIAGEGEPVLMLGGLMNPESIWYRQRDALSPYYRLIAFNKPGLGQSDVDIESLSTEQIIENIAYVFKALNIRRGIDIVGFSFGGMLALEFAYKYPEYVRSMALINSSARKPPRPDNLLILKNEVECCPEVVEINGDFDLSLATLYGKLSYAFDMRERLGELAIPALVLSAEEDRYIDSKQSEELSALLPQSTAVCISGARHFSLLTHADIVNRHLLSFLNAQSKKPA